MTPEFPPLNLGPYINLQVNSLITAVVEEILSNSEYALNFQGNKLVLKSNIPLQIGQSVVVRVKQPSGKEQTAELVHTPEHKATQPIFKPKDIVKILEELNLPKNEKNLKIVSELIKQGAPIEHETIHNIAAIAKTDVEISAAVILKSSGIEPENEAINLIAKFLDSSPPKIESINADQGKVAEAIEKFIKQVIIDARNPTAKTLRQAVETAFKSGPAPQEIINIINETIEGNPQLMKADGLIEELDKIDHPKQKIRIENKELIKLINDFFSDKANIDDIKELMLKKPELIEQARSLILERSVQEIAKAVRQLSQEEFEIVERYSSFSAVNNLAIIREENVYVVELPVKLADKIANLRLHISPDSKGKGGTQKGKGFMLSIDMSRIGKVTARSYLKGNDVKITFNVKDAKVKRLFESHLTDLTGSLEKEGFHSQISVNTKEKEQESTTAPSYYQIDFKI